ncbi:MAG: serine/threonine-protein phosphatase [Clostridiales bacterium]|nr:serine/threonine-protein phosphatase [Clostridiales bacterium]
MIKEFKKRGIIMQVTVLFLIGTLVIGLLTFFSERSLAKNEVKFRVEKLAHNTVEEVTLSLKEYPAYQWLIKYWYDHYEDMDVEYDVDFTQGTKTEEKCHILGEAYPTFTLKYATEEEITSMSEEHQKLYAEIVYSWYITRIDDIKRTYGVDYLFGVMTQDPYTDQFFLFSAADEGAVRGTNYEEVYPLGVQVTVSESQQYAMQNAELNLNHLAAAGNYMDYYSYVDTIDGRTLLIGLTFNIEDMAAEARNSTVSGTVGAVIFQIALSLVCLALIYYFVLKPLQLVQQNIRLYKENKDSKVVGENLSMIKAKNEIGELSSDVTDLTIEIDNYLDEISTITKERERLGAELELASSIQSSQLPNIFPAFPDRKEFDIYATMDPAKAVGGDFYDFFMVDDDHLCMVIADVSGKGIPAALFMMASKIIIGNNAMMGKSPAKILHDANNSICKHNSEEMFITVWLGILEISTGRLVSANAGHEYPMVRRKDGLYETLKDSHGFILGGMEGVKYKETEIFLEPGSSVFVYTDGVPEATASDKSMFGNDRLLKALNQEPDADPEGTLKNIRKALNDFVKEAEQFDDVTMMNLLYIGPAES